MAFCFFLNSTLKKVVGNNVIVGAGPVVLRDVNVFSIIVQEFW
jgi:serine acetyltransferase